MGPGFKESKVTFIEKKRLSPSQTPVGPTRGRRNGGLRGGSNGELRGREELGSETEGETVGEGSLTHRLCREDGT